MLGGDDLTEGVLSRAKLTSTEFRRAKLARAKLDEAEISFTRFEDADLSGADLSKVIGWRVISAVPKWTGPTSREPT